MLKIDLPEKKEWRGKYSNENNNNNDANKLVNIIRNELPAKSRNRFKC